MVATLLVSSRRYAGRRNPIVSVATNGQAGDKISQRAIARTEVEGHGAAWWRGPLGQSEKAALDCYSGGARYQPAPALAARPKLRASEQHAGGGHQGTPKKWPGTEIPAPALVCCQTDIEGYQGAPKKRLGTAIQGYENAGLPRYIGERVDEKSV